MESNNKDITSVLENLKKYGVEEIDYKSRPKNPEVCRINVSSRDIKRLREILSNKEYLENEVFPKTTIEFKYCYL